MLLTIIIPIFNGAPYIKRCVESIMAQSFNHFELILVDDGSTDGSGEICDVLALKDSRIKVIHKPNGGVSSARNEGLKLAQGQWLCFFDADDTIPNGALEAFMKAANTFNPDIVIGGYVEIAEDGKRYEHPATGQKNVLLDRTGVINNILIGAVAPNGSFGSSCVKMFRREIFMQRGLQFPARRRAEDWLLNIRYLEHAQSAVAIDDYVYNYHRNSDSAMSKCFPEQFEIWEENEAIRQDLIRKYGYSIDVVERHTDFTLGAIWYCIRKIAEISKIAIIQDFKRAIFTNAVCDADASKMPSFIRPALYLLKKRCFTSAYYYLKFLNYAIKAKRRNK